MGLLASKYGAPPFSVFDMRQGYWQRRKRLWLSLGIKSHTGRTDCQAKSMVKLVPGMCEPLARMLRSFGAQHTSIFDPVVCELVYRWFSPPGGTILDPFAGGSVRGVVAAVMGRRYIGIDIRGEQVSANRQQWEQISSTWQLSACPTPVWIEGDARDAHRLIGGGKRIDMVFTCPPYHNLEIYSDNPHDLSNMTYDQFIQSMRHVTRDCLRLMSDDRFAAIVIGDIRDRTGIYRGMDRDILRAFNDAGAHLYNEAVLITPSGIMAMRAEKAFTSTRKLARGHQYLLVSVKGNARRAARICRPDLQRDYLRRVIASRHKGGNQIPLFSGMEAD